MGCKHLHQHVELLEVTPAYERSFYVCDTCEEVIPLSEADPVTDAIEDMADNMQEGK